MKLESQICPNCGSRSIDQSLQCEQCGSQLKWSEDKSCLRIVGLSGACPKCNFDNPASNRFCSKCGTAMVFPCGVCGKDHPVGTVYCSEKGVNIQEFVAKQERDRREVIRATEERRRLEEEEQKRQQEKARAELAMGNALFAGICVVVPPVITTLFRCYGSADQSNAAVLACFVASLFGCFVVCLGLLPDPADERSVGRRLAGCLAGLASYLAVIWVLTNLVQTIRYAP